MPRCKNEFYQTMGKSAQNHQLKSMTLHFPAMEQANLKLGGGFKQFLFSPLPGEMIQI